MILEQPIKCPSCGFESADLDDWDVVGACGDNLFCQRCSCEIEPSGKEHKRGKCCKRPMNKYPTKL